MEWAVVVVVAVAARHLQRLAQGLVGARRPQPLARHIDPFVVPLAPAVVPHARLPAAAADHLRAVPVATVLELRRGADGGVGERRAALGGGAVEQLVEELFHLGVRVGRQQLAWGAEDGAEEAR